ncbi:MAG: 30S ribosome-binding factor RbfA [Saprospiraceae bacterium]|nr:30S ribosome-binding factor RbfA [Saprospiraceae bacterium]
MPTIRQKQVAELVRRNFSIILLEQGRYIFDDALVTVTEVQMSPDLLMAKVYLSVYNTENKQSVLLLLEEQHQELRQSLGRRLRKQIRRIPDMTFFIDDTLDEMERVDKLFKRLEASNQMGTDPVRSGSEEE